VTVGDSKRIPLLVVETDSGQRSAARAIAEALRDLHDEECLVGSVSP
jgi:hypothetical protein